jgi:outer membrane protein
MDMSKLFVRLAFAAAASVLITGAAASSSYAAGTQGDSIAGVRIGYVDFTRALNQVSDGKEAKKRLRGEFKEKQDRLNNLQSELTKMKEEIERDRVILSTEELQTKEGLYRQKLMDVQRRFADFRREMSEREAHLTKEILGRLRKTVQSIGERDGYSLILEKSQELVIYTPAAEDLTDIVIKEYNRGTKKRR